MRSFNLFLLVFLALCQLVGKGHGLSDLDIVTDLSDLEIGELHKGQSKFLFFVQSWPPTFCSTHYGCMIPKEVTTWTVHGLWPDRSQGPHPAFCNRTMKYDPAKVEPFIDEMHTFWPNLLTKTSHHSFWKHEYEKHGTCATGFPGLETEEKFFKSALHLREAYDMGTVLKRIKVSPSYTKRYNVKRLYISISKLMKSKPTIWCAKTKGVQHIAQIGFCFDREMTLKAKCRKSFVNCNLKESAFYLPF